MNLGKNGWKALPLVVVAIGGMLWHVLACVESPMSFALNGDLAFTTMEPYKVDGNDLALRGTHLYRLMVLPAGAEQPKVLESSSDWMITAPAFSRDGERIAYLRIPLLAPADLDELERLLQITNQVATQPAYPPTDFRWPAVSETPEPTATTAPVSKTEDITLPSMEMGHAFHLLASLLPTIPAQLVQRAAADGRVLSVSKVDLPLNTTGNDASESVIRSLMMTYVMSRPQYSPDGRWIYLCPGSFEPGGVVWAVDPQGNETRLVAAGAMTAALAPDGKTLAVLQNGCLGFVRTDGSLSSYVRLEKDQASLGGMAWVDNTTVALLGSAKVEDKQVQVIDFMKTDGTIARTLGLPAMQQEGDADTGQLAVSPDGKHLVIASEKATSFLDSLGTLLGSWQTQDGNDTLAQPTFTPDGTQVAFKYLTKQGDVGAVQAIVFFNPEGKELRRVSVPPVESPAVQPAEGGAAPVPPAPPADEGILAIPPPAPPTEAPKPTAPPETPQVKPAEPVEPNKPIEPSEPVEPTSAPVLRPDQEKALEELRPEMP
jgi:Tol biopolymer transport system component